MNMNRALFLSLVGLILLVLGLGANLDGLLALAVLCLVVGVSSQWRAARDRLGGNRAA